MGVSGVTPPLPEPRIVTRKLRTKPSSQATAGIWGFKCKGTLSEHNRTRAQKVHSRRQCGGMQGRGKRRPLQKPDRSSSDRVGLLCWFVFAQTIPEPPAVTLLLPDTEQLVQKEIGESFLLSQVLHRHHPVLPLSAAYWYFLFQSQMCPPPFLCPSVNLNFPLTSPGYLCSGRICKHPTGDILCFAGGGPKVRMAGCESVHQESLKIMDLKGLAWTCRL